MDKEHFVSVSVKGVLYSRGTTQRGEVRLGYRLPQQSRRALFIPVTVNGTGPHFSLEKLVEEHANTVAKPHLNKPDKSAVRRTVKYMHGVWQVFTEGLREVNSKSLGQYCSPRMRQEYHEDKSKHKCALLGGSLPPSERPRYSYEALGLQVVPRGRQNGAKRQEKGSRIIHRRARIFWDD